MRTVYFDHIYYPLSSFYGLISLWQRKTRVWFLFFLSIPQNPMTASEVFTLQDRNGAFCCHEFKEDIKYLTADKGKQLSL